MKTRRLMFIAMLAWTIAACTDGVADDASVRLQMEGQLPALDGAIAWLNSQPLRTSDLRGKVVVVQFWTYTCVNWRRTAPYMRAWASKYSAQGLVVIGVHTPEFTFERDVDNVREATREMNIGYAVAVDSRQRIWNAFGNEYWPALYIIDVQGNIRHHQFGEGGYVESERAIQQLLAEAGNSGVNHEFVSVEPRGLEIAADWVDQRSSETYVGYWRSIWAIRSIHAAPTRLRLDEWALLGNWTVKEEPAVLNGPEGRIVYRFHARDLNLVMSPGITGSTVKFRVMIDGQPPGFAHGTDVDEMGYGNVAEPRTYQLIRQAQPIMDRDFEIEFQDPGVNVFDFTFG